MIVRLELTPTFVYPILLDEIIINCIITKQFSDYIFLVILLHIILVHIGSHEVTGGI